MPSNNPPSERGRLKTAVWKHLDLLRDVASPEKAAENIADFILQEQRAMLRRLESALGPDNIVIDDDEIVELPPEARAHEQTENDINYGRNEQRAAMRAAIQAERGKLS